MAFPSVSLCVTHMLCIKIAKRFIKIVLPPNSPIILVFVTEGHCLTMTASPLTGAPNTRGVRKLGDFWPVVHLGNGVRYGHSGIENHTKAIEWWHFSWPWMTPTLSFKVTLQFEGEYLTNIACYSHSYYRNRIGSHTWATERCHCRWSWVTPPPVSRSPYSSKANISQTVHATAGNMTSHGFLYNSWVKRCLLYTADGGSDLLYMQMAIYISFCKFEILLIEINC